MLIITPAQTFKAIQRVASKHGPIDGLLGLNSHRGFARFLNSL